MANFEAKLDLCLFQSSFTVMLFWFYFISYCFSLADFTWTIKLSASQLSFNRMAPISQVKVNEIPNIPLGEVDKPHFDPVIDEPLPPWKYKLNWPAIISISYFNLSAIAGAYLVFSGTCFISTTVYSKISTFFIYINKT